MWRRSPRGSVSIAHWYLGSARAYDATPRGDFSEEGQNEIIIPQTRNKYNFFFLFYHFLPVSNTEIITTTKTII